MNPLQLFLYLAQNRRLQLFAIGSGLIASVIFVFQLDPANFIWSKTLDPIIGLTTVLVALIIWWDEVSLERENKLPKKLTVRFVYQQQLIMICKETYLIGENDIRAWGLHLGGRMGQGQLSLEPFFEIDAGAPQKDNSGKSYKPYFLQFYLAELPFKENSIERQKVAKGQYLRWVPAQGGKKEENWLPCPKDLPPLALNKNL